jgi:hypothetical protein
MPLRNRHPLARIRRFFPTIRFMLIIGGMVAFALSVATSQSVSDTMRSLGWFMLCATVLFLDPENPPGSVAPGTNPDDPFPLDSGARRRSDDE